MKKFSIEISADCGECSDFHWVVFGVGENGVKCNTGCGIEKTVEAAAISAVQQYRNNVKKALRSNSIGVEP